MAEEVVGGRWWEVDGGRSMVGGRSWEVDGGRSIVGGGSGCSPVMDDGVVVACRSVFHFRGSQSDGSCGAVAVV